MVKCSDKPLGNKFHCLSKIVQYSIVGGPKLSVVVGDDIPLSGIGGPKLSVVVGDDIPLSGIGGPKIIRSR